MSNQTEALDGTWQHGQSSKWDGSAPGVFTSPNNNPTGTSPGGAASLIEGGTNFIRIQDAGNPEVFGYIQGVQRPINSNRRVYLGHDINQEGALSNPGEQRVLNNGFTISFRMRIPTSGTLDSVYTGTTASPVNQNWFVSPEADYNNNGSVDAADYVLWRKGVQPLANEVATVGTTDPQDYIEWRKRFGDQKVGRGYPIHDDGRGMVTILQNNNTSDPFDPFNGVDGTIAFSLVTSKDVKNFCDASPSGTLCSGSGNGGLIMNNLSGDSPNNFVDSFDSGQTLNLLPIPDQSLKDWHEFWITVVDNGALPGTHSVKVYMDGATTPTTFQVTLSSSGNGAYANFNAPFVELGLSSSDLFGSFDMDSISYKLGVITPVAAGSGALGGTGVPELSSILLAMAATASLCSLRQPRCKSYAVRSEQPGRHG